MTHSLSRDQFDELCEGAVGPEVIAVLRGGQYSRRRLLLAALVAAAASRSDVHGPLREVESAWHVLMASEERAPEAVEDVLMWPSTGVWLVRVTRRLHGVDLDGPPIWVELGFLHCLAAAAAVRAQLPCALDLPVVDGVLTLPTVGQVRVHGGFVPVHRHELTGWGVEIDDCTPYRWFSAPEPPLPLGQYELAAWREDLHGAWDVLSRWHPRFAAEQAAGLTVLAPAAPASGGVSASASAAFGGVVLSAAHSPAALAARLVHELQHSKLNALLDLVVLHTRDDADLMYAPWRTDPRPLTGLLHGIYAFTSTMEFWSVQRAHTPEPERRMADFSFVHRWMQVEAAIESLPASDLTEFGARLVEGAARRLTNCPLDDVPPEMIEATRTMMLDHRARWRTRHVRPDQEYVREAAAAWHAGTAAPALRTEHSVVESAGRDDAPATRLRLLRMKAVDPVRFREIVDESEGVDVAFAAGRFDEALTAFSSRLRNAPTDGDAWVGLGLVLRMTGDHPAARVLLDHPEIALGVYERIMSGPEPVAFARWLAANGSPSSASS